MKRDKKYTLVPRDIRKDALEAIKKGNNIEAVKRYNLAADEINQVSFYEKVSGQLVAKPFELI